MTVRIIAAGGTFDKSYLPLTGELGFAESHLPQILQQSRLFSNYTLEVLPLMDSLDMGDSDRNRIEAACEKAAETAIVIIHGTDTITRSAAVLASADMAKTIVMTGAMIPYAVEHSDALFNLGFACASACLQSHGVYIAMNGRLFNWHHVQKNREKGVFETTNP